MRLRLVASLGPADSQIPAFVALSLAAHVLFAAAVLWLGASRAGSMSMEPTVVVGLTDGSELAGGGPAAAEETPPADEPEPEPEPEPVPQEPEPEPEPEGVHAGEEPEKIVEPEEKPDPPQEKPKPKPKPVQPKPETVDPKPTEPPSNPTGTGGSGSGAGSAGDAGAQVGGMEGIDSQFNWYSRQVQAALYREWTQPPLATSLREPVTVTVQFEIQRNGAITGVQLASSSGIAVMDRSVLRAVANATLPPLPPAMRVPSRAVTVNFTLNPDET